MHDIQVGIRSDLSIADNGQFGATGGGRTGRGPTDDEDRWSEALVRPRLTGLP